MALNSLRTQLHGALLLLAMGVVTIGSAQAANAPAKESSVPRLVDLGANTCLPCKKMAPILEQLRHEYAGQLDVVFIDVWKNPDAATPYKIRVIPTQIFYDAAGKELYRHEGFYSGDEILRKWRSFGYYFLPAKTAR